MDEFKRVLLAQGLSVAMPAGWEFLAESDDGQVTFGIVMRSETCNANLELLNNNQIDPRQFISDYRFSLMEGLVDLGIHILEPDAKRLNELIATKEGIEGRIFHTFLPTNPVTHISAIYKAPSDLIDLRLILESIKLDENEFEQSHEEELVAMKISNQWQRSRATS